MANNSNLNTAIKNRDDEFYTRYSDIDNELSHYFEYLRGKTVYCNCDNPYISNFPRYFIRNFHKIGLKRLICTGYNKLSTGFYLDVCKEDIPLHSDTFSDADLITYINTKTGSLAGNGDFGSYECISYLKECDIVITNPPFSKFKEYFELLMVYNVDIMLITLINNLGYRVVLPYVSTGQIKISNFSNTKSMSFVRPPPNNILRNSAMQDGLHLLT